MAPTQPRRSGTPSAGPTAGNPHGSTLDPRFKTAIAVLIAVASLTGALIIFASVYVSDEADGLDRRSIAQMQSAQTLRTQVESALRRDQIVFARYVAKLAEADGLDAQAKLARRRGDERQAAGLEDRASQLRAVQEEVIHFTLSAGGSLTEYVTRVGEELHFDEARRRGDLLAYLGDLNTIPEAPAGDPAEAAAEADRLRVRSFRLAERVFALAVVIALLTFARVLVALGRNLPARTLAGGGLLVYVCVLVSLPLAGTF